MGTAGSQSRLSDRCEHTSKGGTGCVGREGWHSLVVAIVAVPDPGRGKNPVGSDQISFHDQTGSSDWLKSDLWVNLCIHPCLFHLGFPGLYKRQRDLNKSHVPLRISSRDMIKFPKQVPLPAGLEHGALLGGGLKVLEDARTAVTCYMVLKEPV